MMSASIEIADKIGAAARSGRVPRPWKRDKTAARSVAARSPRF
jgi:hypothetical protein